MQRGLGIPDLESLWFAERLAYVDLQPLGPTGGEEKSDSPFVSTLRPPSRIGPRSLTEDAEWRRKVSRTFPRLQSDPTAVSRRKPMGEALFVRECRAALRNLLGFSDLSRPRKELYQELVVGSASDPLSERCGWTAEEICSHWNWAPGSSFLNNTDFSLTR